jgi:hypothetical protein
MFTDRQAEAIIDQMFVSESSTTILASVDVTEVENFPANQTCTTERFIRIIFSFRWHICKFEKFRPIYFNASAYGFIQSLTL